ncbi:hypothetical protein PTKIN_Ptkin12aG0129900 [Pterospermum kingtungense]
MRMENLVPPSVKEELLSLHVPVLVTYCLQNKSITLHILSRHCQPGVFNMDKVMRLASEKGVVLFSKSSCCLCYAVKILFQELGVAPTIHEIDQDPEGREMEKALMRLGCNAPVPAVFIGGNLVGSTNEVMSLHLGGGLIPLLKPYQALC